MYHLPCPNPLTSFPAVSLSSYCFLSIWPYQSLLKARPSHASALKIKSNSLTWPGKYFIILPKLTSSFMACPLLPFFSRPQAFFLHFPEITMLCLASGPLPIFHPSAWNLHFTKPTPIHLSALKQRSLPSGSFPNQHVFSLGFSTYTFPMIALIRLYYNCQLHHQIIFVLHTLIALALSTIHGTLLLLSN